MAGGVAVRAGEVEEEEEEQAASMAAPAGPVVVATVFETSCWTPQATTVLLEEGAVAAAVLHQ